MGGCRDRHPGRRVGVGGDVSDTAPAPAFMDDITPPRSHVQRERCFHSVADRFIDRVVLEPKWTTGINHENELTDNARARARGRGVKSGVHDIYVCQAPGRSCWVELKWGDNEPSDAQQAVGRALDACGIPRGYAWSIHQILEHLRSAGFALHAGADVLAQEYQARAEAAVRKAELKAAAPRKVGKSRPRTRVSSGRIAKAHKAGAWRMTF